VTECNRHGQCSWGSILRCWHRDGRTAVQYGAPDSDMTIIQYFEDALIDDGSFSAWVHSYAPPSVIDAAWDDLIAASRMWDDEPPRSRLWAAEEMLRRLRTA
jgi:hypothetical protein